ncbi:hypothetical protein KVT40_002902 [Elsinoe batatas]|uniref:Uncharacterized protein n=1 Tax=Elsinoe batatas TaxID=2601811 RepID=A0A8K0L4W8_9PEZI|nr:hypothetical protein KVT40_002902 [Elsinoe batatas]
MDFDIFTSISTYDSDRSLRRLLKSRLPGTTLWLLAQDTFQSWKQTTSGGTFLLSGIIGSGKTLCSATAIEHLMRERVDDHAQIFHFHFQESPISLRSGSAALNALIKQILIINPEQSSLIYDKVILYYGPSATEAIFDDILDDIFLPLLQTINEPIVVVDGLDLCDASDLWQLLLALSTAVGRGCRVFLTGRGQESAEVQKSHNASGLTIGRSIYGVGEDLSRIIRLMIESQSRRSNIATDATLAYMNDFLANHVGTMVLWAKLLLDEIWANCVDDSTIKDYLMNRLPVDLKTTYESCVTRLGARKDTLGKSLLMAVCAAVEPFHIEELQEYLALDEVDSMLVSDPERRPTRDSILNCSVNLIEIDDEDDLVRPIHHTVIQYALDESLRRNTLCRIGRFCVISLENAAALIHMGGPWRMFATIPAGTELSTRILGLLGRPTTVKATLTMPSHQPLRKTATAGSKSFLTYAQRAWLQSNRDVGADIIQVRSFRKLLIEALHHVAYPWSYQVKSWTSYITGLFAWAVVNDHRPLLAFSLEEPALRSRLAGLKLDLKAMPIISAEGGTAAHFAARSGDLTLFKLVYSRRLLNITDDFGKTCIYIAAEQGNLELLVSIMRTYEKSSAKTSRTPSFVVDNRGRNILHAAIEGAHSRCIEVLCERSYDTGGNLALVLAAQHDSNGIYSLQFAIGSGDPAIFSFCLSKIIFATASLPALPVGMWTALLDDAFRLQLWAAMGLILEFHPLAANLEGLLMNWCNIWFATYGSSCTPEDLIRTVYLHNPSAVRSVCAELTGEEIATAGVLCHEVIPITFWKKVPGKEFHNALRLVLITDSMALFKLLMIWNFRNFLHTFENAYHDVRWFDQNPNAISADLYIHAYLCMDLRLKLGKVYEVAASNAFHEELLSSLDLRTHVLRDLSTDLIRPFLGYIQTRDTALIDLDNYLDLSFNRIVYSLAKYFGGSFAHWHGNDILLWVLACNGLSMHMENLLQSSRASPNSRCTAGTTSLWQVCVRGYYHCVPSLLHHGADARICNTLDVQILVGWSATPTPVSPSSPVELLRSTNVADLSHIPARRRQQYHRETLDLLIAAETTGPRLADHVREPSRGR